MDEDDAIGPRLHRRRNIDVGGLGVALLAGSDISRSLAPGHFGTLPRANAQVLCIHHFQVLRHQAHTAVEPELLAKVATNLPGQGWASLFRRVVLRTSLGRAVDVIGLDAGA